MLDTIWQWYDHLPEPEDGWHEDKEAAEHLQKRMRMLSLPTPKCSKTTAQQELFAGTYVKKEGRLAFKMMDFFGSKTDTENIEKLTISFGLNSVSFVGVDEGGTEHILEAAMDGSRKETCLTGIAGRALASAEWLKDDLLEVRIRLVETCYEMEFDFTFDGGSLSTESGCNHSFTPDRKERASFEREA